MESFDPPCRVLLVEDDFALGEMMLVILEHQGIDVREVVRSGAAAFDALARGPFDVAIVDLELPDMDGSEVLVELRLRAPDTQLVVCSAHRWDSPRVVQARSLADAVIGKHDLGGAGELVRSLCRLAPPESA